MTDIAAITSGLTVGDDGIWYGPNPQAISYPTDGHSACLAVEEGSFWFNHRNDCIAAAVHNSPPPGNGTIFDVGGGNGYVTLGLIEAGFDVALVEPRGQGASNAKNRGIEVVICSTTHSAGFSRGSLPAIGLFDVIEHIEDDAAFLSAMHTLLQDGGMLYATVPAYRQLWSAADIAAGHFRRYNTDEISAVFRKSGFTIDFSSHIFRPLPLPVFLFRTLPHRLGRGQGDAPKGTDPARSHGTSILAKITRKVLEPEVRKIADKSPMRFGGSILIAARKA